MSSVITRANSVLLSLNHDLATINDVEALRGLSNALACEVIVAIVVQRSTFNVQRLNVGGTGDVTLGTKTTHSISCTDGEFVLSRINGDVRRP